GGRGPGMKVAVGGEALREQRRTNDLAVLEDEASGGLMGEDQSGDAGDEERIAQAKQNGGHDGEANRSLPDGMHFRAPKTLPQGLKPRFHYCRIIGTTKVVPFQNFSFYLSLTPGAK